MCRPGAGVDGTLMLWKVAKDERVYGELHFHTYDGAVQDLAVTGRSRATKDNGRIGVLIQGEREVAIVGGSSLDQTPNS